MGKLVFDYIVSLLLIVLLSPVYLCLIIFVMCLLGRPIFFKQQRPGKGGMIFTIYKFRSMKNDKDHQGKLLPDESRSTRFGCFLRNTSLDELPQLFNILKGEMSFVGPRALLIEYLPLYNHEQFKRHLVKPGITGWAQVNGRNAITWQEKFRLDVWYVENQSFGLDMKILWLTFLKVIKRADINQQGRATMDKFTGNNDV